MEVSGTNTSPLFEYFLTLGYDLGINGNSYAKYFTSPEEEINILYDGVGLIDFSSEGIIELKGKDVLDFLHRISTNSVKELPKESILNTIFTNEKGRMIDSSSILNFDDFQVLVCSSAHKNMLISWLNKYVIVDDVKIQDVPGKYILFQLLGPQADSFITLICGNIVNNIKPGTFKVLSTEGIMFFLVKFLDARDHLSYWVIADNKNGRLLVNYMYDNKDFFNFGFIGSEAHNSYRIEQGIPVSPNEINDKYNPHEAKLLDMVSFTKGCYIGQEVIARLDTYDKVQKYLTGVVFSDPVESDEKFTLFDEDSNEAGIITSSAYSYKCKKYLGLAYIKKAFLEEGTMLSAKNASKSIIVSVHNLPFKK